MRYIWLDKEASRISTACVSTGATISEFRGSLQHHDEQQQLGSGPSLLLLLSPTQRFWILQWQHHTAVQPKLQEPACVLKAKVARKVHAHAPPPRRQDHHQHPAADGGISGAAPLASPSEQHLFVMMTVGCYLWDLGAEVAAHIVAEAY